MSDSLSLEILDLVFQEEIPEWFLENLNFQKINSQVTAFKLVVVLPLGVYRKNRITWSSLGEEEYWLQTVSALISKKKNSFVQNDSVKCRKVLDFDGSWGEIFLDDLHHGENKTDQMCRIFDLDGQEIALIRMIKSPLQGKTALTFLLNSYFLACLSIGGMWAVRESLKGDLISVLWVSESKWKGNIKEVQALVENQNVPKEWFDLKKLMTKHGMTVYPDAIEFFLDGRIDLSLTFI
jgi:hypothetical protein